jgi:hypothetical protein
MSIIGSKDSIHQLERNTQVTIYWLRAGHCRLHQYLRKMGLHPTALCECGLSEQMPEHILQTWPNMSSRQHYWPQPNAIKTKLWGTMEDLRKTTNFVECHGLRVWMVMAERRRRRRRRLPHLKTTWAGSHSNTGYFWLGGKDPGNNRTWPVTLNEWMDSFTEPTGIA